MQNPGLFSRALRSFKNRSKNYLQHALLRSIEKMGAPQKFARRNLIFQYLPSLFSDTPAYSNWEKACTYFITNRNHKVHLIDLNQVLAPGNLPTKKIAIQAHIFYPDLANELAVLLKDFPVQFDLLISTPHAESEKLLKDIFKALPKLNELDVLVTPNRGRDLGPLLYGFGEKLLRYDFFAHVHTKKSVGSNSIGNAWRKYLLDNLLDSSDQRIPKILGLLEKNGMVYPRKFPLIDVENCQWGSNLPAAEEFCRSAKLPPPSPGFIEFPAGSMFWAKTAALKPLLDKSFLADEFEEECGQTDNTIMHALERSLSHIALAQGYSIALLHDSKLNRYYP
jgi:lipopolysaccharide biosynthesis protein